jgi:hypothetical protein
MGFASDGSRLHLAKDGSALRYSPDLGATWTSAYVSGHADWFGLEPSCISLNGAELLIGYSQDLILGRLQ